MAESGRRELLLGLVAEAIAQHDKWAARSDLTYITAGVDEAMTDLIAGFEEGSIPGDCRELANLVAAFGQEWRAWQRMVDERGSAVIPPKESCWRAWEALVGSYQGVASPPPVQIESVATLRAQKVPDRQICEIYGWVNSHGTPETHKIDEELAEPGKHTKGWVDPITQRRQEAAEKDKSLHERVRRMREAKVARMDSLGKCPESLPELVQQGVSLPQIAAMLRLSEENVLALCEAEGLPRPPAGPSVAAMRSDYEPEPDEAMARQFAAQEAEGLRVRAADAKSDVPDGDGLSLEQRIVQLHEQGFEAADIATELTTENEKVSQQKVRAVIKRYEEDPDAIAMPGG